MVSRQRALLSSVLSFPLSFCRVNFWFSHAHSLDRRWRTGHTSGATTFAFNTNTLYPRCWCQHIPPTGTSYLTMCTCRRRSTASVVSAAQRYSIRQINTLDILNRAKHRQLFQKRTRASVSADCRLPRNFLARLGASGPVATLVSARVWIVCMLDRTPSSSSRSGILTMRRPQCQVMARHCTGTDDLRAASSPPAVLRPPAMVPSRCIHLRLPSVLFSLRGGGALRPGFSYFIVGDLTRCSALVPRNKKLSRPKEDENGTSLNKSL